MVLRAEQAGGWEIARPAADDELELVGFRDRAGQGLDMQVLPAPRVTLVLMLDGELRVDRAGPVEAGIASGLGVAEARVRGRDVACVDIHLSPLTAYSVLNGAAAELAGSVVGFEEVWGPRAHQLRAALARYDRWEDRFAELRAVLTAEQDARRVYPEVAFAWRELVASGGLRRVSDLAVETGWSRKRLWSRFTTQLGVTPKRAGMLVRLSTAIDAIMAGKAAAEVASQHGYADQSHLTRELRALAGYTPAALYRAWQADSGTFVQDPPG